MNIFEWKLIKDIPTDSRYVLAYNADVPDLYQLIVCVCDEEKWIFDDEGEVISNLADVPFTHFCELPPPPLPVTQCRIEG